MKRSIARKWAKELDSGYIIQIQGNLRNKVGMCVMGVLCNVHAEAHPDIAKKQKTKRMYMGEDIFLPNEVIAWSGMYDNEGSVNPWVNGMYHGTTESLVDLNDTGTSFPVLAKYIRKNWKLL